MPRPLPSEYGTFFGRYMDNAVGDDVLHVLEHSVVPLQNFLGNILEEKGSYSYAPGKWTIKQMIQHLIDAERVFAYRAMCIARGETQALPGFDENVYANNVHVANRSMQSLISELMMMRQSTIMLFRHLDEKALLTTGIASGYSVTPNALGFIIVGHANHHQNILLERYLD